MAGQHPAKGVYFKVPKWLLVLSRRLLRPAAVALTLYQPIISLLIKSPHASLTQALLRTGECRQQGEWGLKLGHSVFINDIQWISQSFRFFSRTTYEREEYI